jgi:hypothetical protein
VAEDRLKKIDEQISKLKAQKQAILNRAKGEDRKRDTRKKILIGGLVLKLIKTGEWTEAQLLELADRELSLDRDRLLFGLAPKDGGGIERDGESEEALLAVKVEFSEKELRTRIKEAGGKWDKEQKVWFLPPAQVEKLALQERVI